jgi:hypothetical protein
MTLDVRAWNVLFGDAILISWDEADRKHHAMVDFGNFTNDPNASFQDVFDDVLGITDGHLDLVVITHRHLDHLEGFYSLRASFARDFTVDRLWHAHVTSGTDAIFELAGRRVRELAPAGALAIGADLGGIYRNNFGAPGLTTKDRMDDIEAEMGVPASGIFAVHREQDLDASGAVPPGWSKMSVEVIAPEQESLIYLTEDVHAMAMAAATARGGSGQGDLFPWRTISLERSEFAQLADFARLRRRIRAEADEVLDAVNTTRNNTSVVTRWTYSGATGTVTLLLAGDAQEKSWAVMRDNGVDFSADLIKVGHHGSHNASPDWAFAEVFPDKKSINRVLLTTDPTRFTGVNEVPKAEVLSGWRGRVIRSSRLKRTDSADPGKRVGFRFSVG